MSLILSSGVTKVVVGLLKALEVLDGLDAELKSGVLIADNHSVRMHLEIPRIRNEQRTCNMETVQMWLAPSSTHLARA